MSAAALRLLAFAVGFLWLAMAAALFLVAILAAVVSPAALIYAAAGIIAFLFAALFFTRARPRRLFLGSTVAGLVSLAVAIGAAFQGSLLPVEIVVGYAAVSAIAAFVSGVVLVASR